MRLSSLKSSRVFCCPLEMYIHYGVYPMRCCDAIQCQWFTAPFTFFLNCNIIWQAVRRHRWLGCGFPIFYHFLLLALSKTIHATGGGNSVVNVRIVERHVLSRNEFDRLLAGYTANNGGHIVDFGVGVAHQFGRVVGTTRL